MSVEVAPESSILMPRSPSTEEMIDNWNPVFVREVRRLIKSRAFVVTFLLMLFFCWVVSVFLTFQYSSSIAFVEAGGSFCLAYLNILAIPLFFVIPLTLFNATTSEHSQETLEMMMITTLSPGGVLKGYFLMGLAHSLVYCSAVVPFISFSFLLRGVGLFDIAAAFFLLIISSTLASAWGMTLGACADKPIKRIFCTLLTIMGGFFAFSVSTSANAFIIQIGLMNVEAFVGGFACLAFIAFPAIAIATGIARQKFQLIDPLVKPYYVRVKAGGDRDGDEVEFLPRYRFQQQVLETN